jgi:hypothetical protein
MRTANLIVLAFEEVREGLSIDNVLADPSRTVQFLSRCRDLGLQEPDAWICKKLLGMRKHTPSEIKFSPTTVKPQLECFEVIAAAAEFALMHVRYRYGASADDILSNAHIGLRFDSLAKQLSPGWTPWHYRVAALRIRKSRHFETTERTSRKRMKLEAIAEEWRNFNSLGCLRPQTLPQAEGIFSLSLPNKQEQSFYIMHAQNMRTAFKPLANPGLLDSILAPLWAPVAERLQLRILLPPNGGPELMGFPMGLWERKLIEQRCPLFNWPIRSKAA